MTLLNIPESHIASQSSDETTYDFDLTVFTQDDMVKFDVNGLATSWLNSDDDFVRRIQFENLNRFFITSHLAKEIEVKNILDEGRHLLEAEKYLNAIKCFDEVIFYDKNYSEALLLKSHALFGQGHFVKAFRYYERTLKADAYLKDIEFHKLLLENVREEINNFPDIKLNIYFGDEYFSREEFRKAIESYDTALSDSSKFKSKILHKLLYKKGTVLFKLRKFSDALECFNESLKANPSDYARFMSGFCRYSLGLELDDSFLKPLNITKEQQLYRALILNEVKRYDDAIRCIDDLLSVHFTVDKMYFIALSCKISAMESLGMDADSQKELLDML